MLPSFQTAVCKPKEINVQENPYVDSQASSLIKRDCSYLYPTHVSLEQESITMQCVLMQCTLPHCGNHA